MADPYGPLFMLLRSQKIEQHKTVGILIVCHFFVTVVTWQVSWFNDFIGRFSLAAKPRPQNFANFINRLTAP